MSEPTHFCAGGCGGQFPESKMVDEMGRRGKRWYCSRCWQKRNPLVLNRRRHWK